MEITLEFTGTILIAISCFSLMSFHQNHHDTPNRQNFTRHALLAQLVGQSAPDIENLSDERTEGSGKLDSKFARAFFERRVRHHD